MKIRKKLISPSFAKAGMRLGAPIQDNSGKALLLAGAELSEESLESLLKRDIPCILVLEADVRSEEELAIERTKVTEHIDALFRQSAAGENLESLHRLILEYRLEPHL